jgi:hypothetical protein
MVGMRRVSSTLESALVVRVAARGRGRAFLNRQDKLVRLPGSQDEAPPAVPDQVTGQHVLEVPVSQTFANLGQDPTQGPIDLTGHGTASSSSVVRVQTRALHVVSTLATVMKLTLVTLDNHVNHKSDPQ